MPEARKAHQSRAAILVIRAEPFRYGLVDSRRCSHRVGAEKTRLDRARALADGGLNPASLFSHPIPLNREGRSEPQPDELTLAQLLGELDCNEHNKHLQAGKREASYIHMTSAGPEGDQSRRREILARAILARRP